MSASDEHAPSVAPSPSSAAADELPVFGELPFRDIVEGMEGGVAFLDRDRRFRYANPAAAAHLGSTPTALLGRSIHDHHPRLDGSEVARRLEQSLDGSGPQRFEAPVPSGEDGARWCEFSVRPTGDGILVLSRDVTELHHTTAELRDREAELRRTLGSVDAVIAWSLREGGPLTVSPQIEQILGWPADGIRTYAAWNSLIHPDDLPACLATWAEDLPVWALQYRMRRADGTYATVSDQGQRFTSEAGERGKFGVIMDITERVAADAALAESEERLREIVEGVDAIVAFQERAGTGLLLSPPVERILGWKPADIPDFDAWHALVHPDDLPMCMEVWADEPPSWSLEYRMRRADGTWAWVVDRGRRMPTGDGSGAYTFGVVMDTTASHEAAEALRESDERQRRTIESLDAIVSLQEHAGAPIISSPQMEQILGIDPATVTTFNGWRALIHPDDLPRCLAVWDDRPPAWALEYRMRHADGHYVWVFDRGRRIAREDGLGEGTFGIVVDVTERHAAAEALRASEEQLRRIVDGVDAIISYQEASGDPVIISPQIERILGHSPERLAPFDDWRAAIHPDDLPACVRVWDGRGLTWDMEYRMRRADGAWIWVNDRGVRVLHDDGRGPGLFAVITDVTAQHEAADRLRASEARFRTMFEEIPEAIGVLRPVFGADGRFRDAGFVAANRTTRERWLGGVPVELVPGTPASGLWFTGGEEVQAAVAQVAVQGEPRRAEVRTERDGVLYWSDLSVFPFEDGVAFVGRDITDQKRADLAVRDSEARFRAVTDSAADAIITIDATGAIVGWNPSAERMFAFPAGGLDRQPVTVLMPDGGVAEHLATARPADEDAGPAAAQLTQVEGRRADGTAFPIEVSVAGWTLEGRRYATAIIRDITERQVADEAVRSAAAFQRSVMDSMAEGLVIVGPDGRVASANARAAVLLGHEADGLAGHTVGVAWGSRDGDGRAYGPGEGPSMTALRTGRSSRDVEISSQRPDGTRVWLRVNTEPLRDRDGVVVASVSTFSDITAEREMREQLRRAQRLEAVGQLAGGVAHDFNNLLAAIRGYADLALAALPTASPGRSDIEQAIRAADRAAVLTRQLLQFSRREVLAPRPVDPGEVIDGLIPMLRQLVGEHIELVASRDPRAGVVLADPGQLEQVIVNLVVNARDAMPSGGRIDVTIRRAEPTEASAPDAQLSKRPAIRITVADTGHGIDPDALPHIFEPFFTTKEGGRGSGMGLATVYGIVGASGGTVSVDSSPGHGTTFTVDLPIMDEPAAEAEESAPASNRLGRVVRETTAAQGAVLLVEDDVAVRAVLARLLGRLGWMVAEQPSGTAAAAAAAAGDIAQPDLLVTDVRMPGIQGPDLARRLREAWPNLPVLFITGLADEVGADEPWVHVLTKPFTAAQLSAAIEAVLSSRG